MNCFHSGLHRACIGMLVKGLLGFIQAVLTRDCIALYGPSEIYHLHVFLESTLDLFDPFKEFERPKLLWSPIKAHWQGRKPVCLFFSETFEKGKGV